MRTYPVHGGVSRIRRLTIGKSIKAGLAAGVLSAALLTAGLAQAEDERVRWNMASWFPSNLTQLGTLGKSMVDRLDAISGGNIQIKFFEPNALIPAKECFDAVAAGSVDACWSKPDGVDAPSRRHRNVPRW